MVIVEMIIMMIEEIITSMIMMIVDLGPTREVEAKSHRGDKIRKPHPQNHLIVTSYINIIFKLIYNFHFYSFIG